MANKSSFKMLLFSKYSDPSKKLLGLIQENNLTEKLNINLVCIDNEIVRNKIQSSEIEINVVPCLLVVQDKNQVEKYEGKELNEWILFQFQIERLKRKTKPSQTEASIYKCRLAQKAV